METTPTTGATQRCAQKCSYDRFAVDDTDSSREQWFNAVDDHGTENADAAGNGETTQSHQEE